MRKPRRSEDFREYSIVKGYADSEIWIERADARSGNSVALIFPNSYRVAASSLAFSFVQKLLNSTGVVSVERFFFEDDFKKFYSLDDLRPLDEFRVWAFSVHFELDVLNVLEILRIKSIPLSWRDRDETHPLILVGGALTYFNTDSLWEVADAVYHGDLEPFAMELSNALAQPSKSEMLMELEKIPAVTVPALSKRGILAKVRDLSATPPVAAQIPKHGEFAGTLLLEIGRGCIRRCAFCMAGHVQKPARFVKIDVLSKILKRIPKDVKLGLISATVTDYPWLNDLLNLLDGRKFSVSSMRVDGLSEQLLKALRRSGQRSFTIAPEGGSQKMRDVLLKDVSEEDITNALKLGRRVGFESIKMYFIYGLEEEDEEDLKSISDLADLALGMGYRVKLSLNPLIPKPGTPFQSRKMQDLKTLLSKERYLRSLLKKPRSRVNFESVKKSVVQRAIAASDTEMSRELVSVFERGGRKRAFKFLMEEGNGR